MPQIKGNYWYRIVIPAGMFVVTVVFHYLWLGLFPEYDPIQSQWISLPSENSWFRDYIEAKNYWLGYSYGLSVAFATAALINYLKSPCRASRTFAIGGVTFTGFLAVAGCFLIGCCGSPMLIVWLNLFGAAFIPFAKPFIAIVTTISIAMAWFWMLRRSRSQHSGIPLSQFPETADRQEETR